MKNFPPSPESLLLGELPDGFVAYDLANETRHRLDPASAAVLQACDGHTDRVMFIARQAATTGLDTGVISEKVDAVLAEFARLGLTGETPALDRPPRRRGSTATRGGDAIVGPPHQILDLTIRFRSTDADLIDEIDRYLGTARPAEQPSGPRTSDAIDTSLIFEVRRHADGEVDLITDETVGHDQLGTLLRRLVTVTGEYAIQTSGCTVLHAGGVRSPDGRVVILPGPSGHGKSTLTAMLLATRWDYLGDDMIGIDTRGAALGYPKRVGLGPVSRRVIGLDHSPDRTEDPTTIFTEVHRLGGPVGLPAAIVFPTYQDGAECSVEPLDSATTLDELIANTLNLAVVGQRGFDTLCDLATHRPAYRLTHGDAIDATQAIDRLLTPEPAGSNLDGAQAT